MSHIDYYGEENDVNEGKETQRDPTGKGQHEHGAKVDAGKPDLSLLGDMGRALHAVAEVGTAGANKYTRGGWLGVPDGINRYTAAMLRHYFQEAYERGDGELIDYGFDVSHAAQVAWNALARLELTLREEEKVKDFLDSREECIYE